VLWRSLVALPLPLIAGLLARMIAPLIAKRWGEAP
jgi:hypothetical protein